MCDSTDLFNNFYASFSKPHPQTVDRLACSAYNDVAQLIITSLCLYRRRSACNDVAWLIMTSLGL